VRAENNFRSQGQRSKVKGQGQICPTSIRLIEPIKIHYHVKLQQNLIRSNIITSAVYRNTYS